MEKMLVTFSGRYGDILWSLASVRQLALQHAGTEIHFGYMPQYSSLQPLLEEQRYITKAFPIKDWLCTGSPFADQPWEAPVLEGYDTVRHLTHRFHPSEHLVTATFRNTGLLAWVEGMQPFIETQLVTNKLAVIAIGFNEHYGEQKKEFLRQLTQWLWHLCPVEALRPHLVDATKLPWLDAARVIRAAKMFIGCRSSQAVLAHGVGQKCLIYEPAPERRPVMFGSPYGTEVMPDVDDMDAFIRTAGAWLQ